MKVATEIKTWQIKDNELKEINSTLEQHDRREKEHLEKWIKACPDILGNDILIIGEQVNTKSGPLDYLGIDNSGNIVVIELKRDKLPRECVTQAIDYASDVATWDIDRLSEICIQYNGQALYDYLSENLMGVELDDLIINKAQRLLLVGFAIEEPLNRMVEWLSTNYDIGINAIILKYIKTTSGDELLSKTVIIPEEVEKAKTNKKKFTVEMSDEPGDYSYEDLKEVLVKYLNKDLHSVRRLKKIMLPYLMENNKATREKLKSEFVRVNEAEDEKQAGFFLALISNQLGQKGNDFLRQIIKYDYPNNPWEKDNFELVKEYREMVSEILSGLDLENVKVLREM